MTPGWFQITLKVFLRTEHTFLILRDSASRLGDLPGGRIGESEIYTGFPGIVRRELLEELGADVIYELSPRPLFIFPHTIDNGGHPALGVAYEARFVSGEISLSDEHDWMTWAKPDFDFSQVFRSTMLSAVETYVDHYFF